MEDPIPAGQVPLMKEKFSGIGGETLRDHPHITSFGVRSPLFDDFYEKGEGHSGGIINDDINGGGG